MRIRVDKMPEIPMKCFFIGTFRNRNGIYTGCKLNKNRKCECTADCGFLVAEDETTVKNDFQHFYVDVLPRCPGECEFSIGKATPFDCDYDECTIDGKPCVDVEDCKYLKTHYTSKTYQEAAMRTADPKLNTEESLLEGLIGLNSEAGEALDIYKKHVFQKHDLDKEKIALELGDALWYLTEAAVAIGCSLDDIMEMNIEKLKKRYPYGFDPERSRNRKD